MAGYVLWEGESIINKEPIGVILTTSSTNRKTGDMVQVWVMPQDKPMEARKANSDVSVGCGVCPIKDNCYVVLMYGPNQVWKTWKNNKYEKMDNSDILKYIQDKPLRWGAYGDPAIIPTDIIKIFSEGRKYKGYTHLWKKVTELLNNDELNIIKEHMMASVESEEDAILARSQGWKTFRIRKSITDSLMNEEIMCPASNEANHKIQCISCNNCCGSKSHFNIAIVDHGPKSRGKK